MHANSEALKEQLDAFGSELKLELSPALPKDRAVVNKSLELLENENAQVKTVNETLISGSVWTYTETYEVGIDLDFPSFSTCSCSQESWCSHQIALFFQTYQDPNVAEKWLEDWLSSKAELTDIPGVMRASDLLSQRVTAEDGPKAWMTTVHRTAQKQLAFDVIQANPYALEFEGRQVLETLLKQKPSKREWQPLYELYVNVGLLTYMMKLFNDSTISPEVWQRSGSSFLYYLVEEAADAAASMSVHALPFEFDDYIHYLQQETTNIISPKWHVFEEQRIDLYRYLWNDLFKREAWRKEERLRLEQLPRQPKDVALSIAYLHQLLLANQLELFVKVANELEKDALEYYMFWLHDVFSVKQYEKARVVLTLLEQKLEPYLQQLGDSFHCRRFVNWLLTYCDREWLMTKEPLLYRSLLERMLPYSYSDLSMYLLTMDQIQEWVELQSWVGYDLIELDRVGLKEAQKSSPQEVLPLYHHGIDLLVSQRNRDSYKKAVRYLKRLRTLYKKLKRTDRWEQYVTALLEETKRLRAFQEECRKGKLIDV
ncbi:hypothetical protein [Bacillus sp. FJAT-42315]|uniref:hypothetical protein n=1 Tax=Bacillus sp. FJAT-42315 TaxID=2014077 RepID=UPI000C23FE4C|nr:hypothetical protein [Bacillus sp. FJAT-42315]